MDNRSVKVVSILIIIAILVAQWQGWLPNSMLIRIVCGIVVVLCIIVMANLKNK